MLTSEWQKSTKSSGGDNCVEVRLSGDRVEVRNSKAPGGSWVSFTRGEWAAFTEGVADGELTL